MISQVELAKRSGIERAQISKIENGNINVTVETIERLCHALNLSIRNQKEMLKMIKGKPFVKWAGGKRQIIDKLKQYIPDEFNTYYEPFVGGGALFFELSPSKAYINDFNAELICVYTCLKNDTFFKKMLKELDKHEKNHNEDYYYEIRDLDRDNSFTKLPIYIRAARMIYLNKSCFNGLYRVNSKGYFNVPSGKKDKVNTYDKTNMDNLKKYFGTNDITILNGDFEDAVKNAKAGDFVYFDPPYDTLEDKKSFTSYAKNDFGQDEQRRLANVYKTLSAKGVRVMLSNHNTKLINDLYKDFNIHVINARRNINSRGDSRGPVEEVIITNY